MTGRRRDPVGRMAEVLKYLAEQPDSFMGVSRIADALEMQQSTTSRLLANLLEDGIVDRDGPHGGYRVGMEILRIAHLASAKFDPAELAQPTVDALAAEFNETVFFALYHHGRKQIIRIATRSTTRPLQYVIRLHEWTEIYRGASGLGVLAFLPPKEAEPILAEAARHADDEHPFLEREALTEELARIRERGYAITHGRRVEGAVGFAAPVYAGRDEVLGAVIVTVPEARVSTSREAEIAQAVVRAARELTEREMTSVRAMK